MNNQKYITFSFYYINSSNEISIAIKKINKLKSDKILHDVDAIIIARGGGSVEDLWGFNEENVIISTFESKIPIISAIGHETDVTLIDYVADLRAPTPSAAIELCLPVSRELKRKRQRIYTMASFFIHEFVKLKKSNHQTKHYTKYHQNWLRFHY